MPFKSLSGGSPFLRPRASPPIPFVPSSISLWLFSSCSDQTPSYSQGGFGDQQPPKRPIRRERDDKVHDSLIEERIGRERPCRTLFIRNIKVNLYTGATLLGKLEPIHRLGFPLQGTPFLRNDADRQSRNAHSMRPTAMMFAECSKSTERSRPFST